MCRYIASATIKDEFCTEDLNSDLFQLLIKEDLWGKNIDMIKLKESFKYIDNIIQFKIKTKHIFNLFEILIGLSNKEYLSFESFDYIEEEKGKKEKDNSDILEISETKKEIPEEPFLQQVNNNINQEVPLPHNHQKQRLPREIKQNKVINMKKETKKLIMKAPQRQQEELPIRMMDRNLVNIDNNKIRQEINLKNSIEKSPLDNSKDINNSKKENEKNDIDDDDLEKNKNSILEDNEEYNMIKRRKKFIYEQLEKSNFFSKYLDTMYQSEKNNNNKNLKLQKYSDLFKEIIKYGSIFTKEGMILKMFKFIKEPKIDINFSSLQVKKDILQVKNNIKDIITFNKNMLVFLFEDEKLEFYLFDKGTFRDKPNFKIIEINNLESINNINRVIFMKESIDGLLLVGTSNGHIMKLKIIERKKKNKSNYILQLSNGIKLDNKNRIYNIIEIGANIFVIKIKDEKEIKIWNNNKIVKILEKGEIFNVNNCLIVINSSIIFYDIKNNFKEISKIEKKIINPKIINEKILLGEDGNAWKFHLIDIEQRKILKEKEYKPKESFILKNICKKWAFCKKQNNKTKLIKIDCVNDNNNYDVICKNEESITIDSYSFLINLFDEIFITNKGGNINCYGCYDL